MTSDWVQDALRDELTEIGNDFDRDIRKCLNTYADNSAATVLEQNFISEATEILEKTITGNTTFVKGSSEREHIPEWWQRDGFATGVVVRQPPQSSQTTDSTDHVTRFDIGSEHFAYVDFEALGNDALKMYKKTARVRMAIRDIFKNLGEYTKHSPAPVGSTVKIWWTKEKVWFTGEVAGYDAEKNTHHIIYEDGDQDEEMNLAQEKFRVVSAAPSGEPLSQSAEPLSQYAEFAVVRPASVVRLRKERDVPPPAMFERGGLDMPTFF